MGCGSSNDTTNKPSSKQKQIGKLEDFKLQNAQPKTALIFIYKDLLVDLTKNFIQNSINLGNSYYNMLKDFKMDEFQKQFSDADKFTVLIDIESSSGFQFLIDFYRLQTENEEIFIQEKKIQFLIICGNSETGLNPLYSGKVIETYKMWLCGTFLKNYKIAFIDRKTWQTCNVQNILSDILGSDQQVLFYPGGKKTQQNVKQLLSNANEDTFNRRQYVFQLIGMGTDEMEITEGWDYFEANYLKEDLALPTFNPPAEKNVQPFQQSDYLSTNKHAIVFGEHSTALLNKHISKFVQYDKITQDYDFTNKEFAFVFDYRENLNLNAISGQFISYEPNATYIAFHVIPKQKEKQLTLFYTLSRALENFQLNIFLEDGHPQNPQFIDSIMNYQGDWLDFYQALVPYPRMNFFVPYYQNTAMLTQIDGDVNIQQSILTAVTFNTKFQIPESSYFLNGKYNRLKYYQNGSNNQFSLVGNYDFLIKLFEQIHDLGADDCIQAFKDQYGDKYEEYIEDIDYFNDYYAILLDYREAKMEMVVDDDDELEDEDD